jgi:hypothetical protein
MTFFGNKGIKPTQSTLSGAYLHLDRREPSTSHSPTPWHIPVHTMAVQYGYKLQ